MGRRPIISRHSLDGPKAHLDYALGILAEGQYAVVRGPKGPNLGAAKLLRPKINT